MLPEINHTIAWLTEEELLPKMDFNLGELLMLIGFFIIYLIEELVHNYLHRHQRKVKKAQALEAEQNGDAFIRGIQARNSALGKSKPDDSDFVPQETKTVPELAGNHGHGHSHSHVPVPHSEDEDMLVSSLRGLLIVLALSIHELFEGFAVGLEKTSASQSNRD